jgi:NADH-quinone oxidoreductase subunit M
MIRKAWLGEMSPAVMAAAAGDMRWFEKLALGAIVVLILWLGIYPQCLLGMTEEVSGMIIQKADISHLLKK